MSERRKCFTFIWKIKNFSYCLPEIVLSSPTFLVHVMGGTKWLVFIHSHSLNFSVCVASYIQGQYSDTAPDQLEFDYELSFLAGDGSALHSAIFLKRSYEEDLIRGDVDTSATLHVERAEMFLFKKDVYLPDDTLTIRCRMWDCQNSVSLSGKCLAETVIETESKSFTATAINFSHFKRIAKYPLWPSASTEIFFSSMGLCILADDKLLMEIETVYQNHVVTYKCRYLYEIFIRDIFGNKVKYGQGEFDDLNPHYIPLTISKAQLMKSRRFYFPKDELTIECVVTFRTGKIIKKVGAPEYGFDYGDTKQITSCARTTNFPSKEPHCESFTSLQDGLKSLLRCGILCDTKLKTATESFPAHVAVLSARSLVFKSMFTNETKEKINKCVDIDDFDADTVRRMLTFMYTDTLNDLEYESAQNLYFAADKYHINSLKQKCSDFLVQNIRLEKCCDILLLADKYRDKDLKTAVQDFIAENDEAVLTSDEWKRLEKDHLLLTIETFRAVYMKIR